MQKGSRDHNWMMLSIVRGGRDPTTRGRAKVSSSTLQSCLTEAILPHPDLAFTAA